MSPDLYIQSKKHSRKITKIIVHCTATREGDNSIDAAWVDRLHRRKGWSEIGYHFVIKIDGTVEFGRDLAKTGAHVKSMNKYSIGVSYVGGVLSDGKTPKDTRTLEQKESLSELLKSLKRAFPDATIHGHNNFSSKACPCFNAREEYKNIKG